MKVPLYKKLVTRTIITNPESGDESQPVRAKAKLIGSKPKAVPDLTSYRIHVVWDPGLCTAVSTSLPTAHIIEAGNGIIMHLVENQVRHIVS